MYYIQRKDQYGLETVSQNKDRKDAQRECKEWQLTDPSASYYVSTRPCKGWK